MIQSLRCSQLHRTMHSRTSSRVQPCNSVKVSSSKSQLASPKRRYQERPSISYSIRKYDVCGDEVAELLQASRAPFMDEGRAAGPREKHYSYWTTLPGTTHGEQFDTAISHSIAVVSAFVTVQDEEIQASNEGGPSNPSGSSSSNSNFGDGNDAWRWRLQFPDEDRPRLTKKLIGFARAIGDISLVATIYDLAVHPDLQGFGIGHRLVRSLVQQLYSKGIYDIGLVSSVGNASFFSDCSFEDDRQQSLCMTYTGALPEQGWKDDLKMEMQKQLVSSSLAEGATYSEIMHDSAPSEVSEIHSSGASCGSSGDNSEDGSGGCSSSASSDDESACLSDRASGLVGTLTAQNILALEQLLRVHVHRPYVPERPDKNSTVSNFWNYND